MKKLMLIFMVFVFVAFFARCSSEAGTMDMATIDACIGDTITGVHLGDQFLDNDDAMEFVFILMLTPRLIRPRNKLIASSVIMR